MVDIASIRFVGDSKIVRYTNEARNGARPWRSTGFYVVTDDDRRLVLEVLHHDAITACIVRVFLENPLEMYFSFKNESSIREVENLIGQGIDKFSEVLQGTRVVDPEEEDFEGLGFDPIDIESIKQTLMPLPPPFRPELIPIA